MTNKQNFGMPEGEELLSAILWLVSKELAFCYKDDGKLFVLAIMNDTFGYACADCDEIPLDKVIELTTRCYNFKDQNYKWVPLALWSQKECRADQPFIEPIDKLVKKALKAESAA